MEITRELFEQQHRPRFGNANPERMQLAFWDWMVRGEEKPLTEEEQVLSDLGWVMREGKLKSAYGPRRARDLFESPLDRKDGPIWTFDRMGATRSELPDGRVVCIGGEHEDFYDPDFCIYNDVVVFGRNDQIEIYGYPKEIFSPTDFHAATLIGDRIFVVGCLGYMDARRPGDTPVYVLDLVEYSISKMDTSGEMPGWISEHEANFDARGSITIRGGQIIQEHEGHQRFRSNFEDYSLNVTSGIWHRLTNRNWRQFNINQEDGKLFVRDKKPPIEVLVPQRFDQAVVPSEEWNRFRIIVEGIPVTLTVGVKCIHVVVEGHLSDALCIWLAEEIRANAQAAIQRRCVVEQV